MSPANGGVFMRKIVLFIVFAFLAPFDPAHADTTAVCRVVDPTGTPLNIRLQPNGKIVATARNGDKILVFRGDEMLDDKGRTWLSVALMTSAAPDGYVIGSYVRCP
jgi:hypothetical protein